jgi:hypothetical protein
METHDLPQHPQHIFYQPVIPDGQQRVSRAASPPSIPHAGQGSRRSTTPGAGYQVVKDELRRILIGVVTQLVNPKWWLYGLFEELGASKAFLKQFKGVSDVQIRTAILRSQLTRSKRFAILKRDGYACHYCHRTNVPLACVLTMRSGTTTCRTGAGTDAVRGYAAVLMAGQRGAGVDRRPLGRPGERPQGFGACAGVPSTGRRWQNPGRTRTGGSCADESGRSQGRRRSATRGRARRNCV